MKNDVVADADDVPLVIPEGKYIVLKLDGHTIDRNLTEPAAKGNVFTVYGTLTLTGSGVVTGSKNTENGGAIVNNGTLKLSGSTISGNMSEKDGGAIYSSGTVEFSSGEISGNSAGKDGHGSGGAISAHKGTITVSGTLISTLISDNTAASHGGAIYLGTDNNGNMATLNLEGGTITGNTAGNQGGAILHNGVLSVKGKLSVKSNTAKNGNNIYLRPEKVIGYC